MSLSGDGIVLIRSWISEGQVDHGACWPCDVLHHMPHWHRAHRHFVYCCELVSEPHGVVNDSSRLIHQLRHTEHVMRRGIGYLHAVGLFRTSVRGICGRESLRRSRQRARLRVLPHCTLGMGTPIPLRLLSTTPQPPLYGAQCTAAALCAYPMTPRVAPPDCREDSEAADEGGRGGGDDRWAWGCQEFCKREQTRGRELGNEDQWLILCTFLQLLAC